MFEWNHCQGQPGETTKEDLIQFYKKQYLKFTSIGVGGMTLQGTVITKILIQCTANRFDQLIRGKTDENTSSIEKGVVRNRESIPIKKYDSNRSFYTKITSRFQLKDLTQTQECVVDNYINYADGSPHEEPRYIDKYVTAYNSEIMRAVLSHDR